MPEQINDDGVVAFCRAQLMALATSAKDEKVRVTALEDLLKLEGSFKKADKLVEAQYGGDKPALSIAIQQNVLSGPALDSLKKNLTRVVEALPTGEDVQP